MPMPRLDQLVDELRGVVRRYSPDWTDSNTSDPGITLLGYGVASGLRTTVAGGAVTVSPGLALDPRGNEIIVDRSTTLKIPGVRKPVFLLLEYVEKETDPV